MARQKFPNLKVVHLSSRYYSGYSDRPFPEPYAYETAFGLRWTIEDQINGDPAIDPDPDGDPATNDGLAPSIAWLRTCGPTASVPRSDGLTWLCSDFADDESHVNHGSAQKGGDLLVAFNKSEPTACRWFSPGACEPRPPVAVAGPGQTVSDGDGDGSVTVSVDGSGSHDPDGGALAAFEWTEGAVLLGETASVSVPLAVGPHTLTLTVTDDEGETATDDVVVTVLANRAPLADAGPDAAVQDSDGDGVETVTLDGSASSDPDGSRSTARASRCTSTARTWGWAASPWTRSTGFPTGRSCCRSPPRAPCRTSPARPTTRTSSGSCPRRWAT